MFATVTAKGQITLPVEARRRLKLFPGTKLQFVVIEDSRIEIVPLSQPVTSLKGLVPKPKKQLTLAEIDHAVGQGAGE